MMMQRTPAPQSYVADACKPNGALPDLILINSTRCCHALQWQM
jgi:hypothetical protein